MVKCGFEYGFYMIVFVYVNLMEDNYFMLGENSYKYYNEWMWFECYVICIFMEEMINEMEYN